MVSFKKLFLATSLLLSGVAASPSSQAKEFNVLEKRALFQGSNANQVCENEFVDAMQIKGNGGSATVVDLTGCTALFFFMDNTLRRAVHILCGNERADAETAAMGAAGSNYVEIAAADINRFNDARAGIVAGRPSIEIGAEVRYVTNNLGDEAVTFKATTGNRGLTQGRGTKVCKQSG